MARNSSARAHAGGRARPVASSSALSRAAPRRRSAGGRTSSTSTPAAMRCSPGSRSSPMSPIRSGSGRVNRSLAAADPSGRTFTGTAADPMCSTSSLCISSAPRSATSISAVSSHAPGVGYRVAAADLAMVDAAQVDRDARHRTHFALVAFQRLQPADGDPAAVVLEFVADPDGARGECPGDHRARTADGEGAIDPEPDVGAAVRLRQPLGQRHQLHANPVQVGADDDARAWQAFSHLFDGGRGVREVGLADDDEDVSDAERLERGEVLLGLRHPALGCGDDEHHRGNRPNAREHVGDEPVVARHVDERKLTAVDLGPREAEIDRQAAALLLGQPVGPHAGQPLHEGGLAVVDVACGGYRHTRAHRRHDRLVVLRHNRRAGRAGSARTPRGRRRLVCRCAAAPHRTRKGDGGARELHAGRAAAADRRRAVDRIERRVAVRRFAAPWPVTRRRRRRARGPPGTAVRSASPPARPA